MLAPPQLGHGRRVPRVAHQLVTAQRLDGHDAAARDDADRPPQRLLAARGHRPAGRPPRKPGPAPGAGQRLGVEAPVGGVGVLGRAPRAEREAAHRGAFAVVRQILDDGGARAAVGAVDEGIAVAAVGGVEQLAQAGGAGRGVGRDLPDGRLIGAGAVIDSVAVALAVRRPVNEVRGQGR